MENKTVTNENIVPIEETERYIFLIEESMKLYPCACGWMIHCAVCQKLWKNKE